MTVAWLPLAVCALAGFPALCAAQDSKPPALALQSSITVTAGLETASPGAVNVQDRSALAAIPAVNLDDRLRMVPGFSLLRRTSSLTAHPTTQGVSLRGAGPTGASRTLVLWDGVPLNDPFGGWVYWTRLAPENVDRVEVSPAPSTSVFGDRAMGGVISIFSRQPRRRGWSAGYESGNRGTHLASAGVSDVWKQWAWIASGRAYTSDGYPIVAESARGAIDRPANAAFVAGDASLAWTGYRQRLSWKADMVVEQRRNGTPLQNNSTSFGGASLRYDRELRGGLFSVASWHARGEFRSTFSALAADRTSERLTARQRVPSDTLGAAAYWRRQGGDWNLVAGGDLQRVEGTSHETVFPQGRRAAGGSLFQHGLFLQGDAAWGATRLYAGARHSFAGRHHRFFSPSAGITVGQGSFRARASAYRAFRAPTLNELYREFRAGNAVTLANPLLAPETLWGVETGADIVGERARVRITVFRSSLDGLIANVTLSVAPNLIVRRRQNAASALSQGVELDAARRFGPWEARAGYLYVDSRFRGGARTPQVARHQGSAQLAYQSRRTGLSAGLRTCASQFEDDLNRFLLPGYAVAHLTARRSLGSGLWAQLAIENLLDREFLAGFTPTPLLGPPRLIRVGLRWER